MSIKEIAVVKAIAIVLVVVGHITISPPPFNSEWYMLLRHAIYKFHMPLFVFTSALLISISYERVLSFGTYADLVLRKIKRFAPPFFLVAILIFFGKYVLSEYIYVDNAPIRLGQILDIVLRPSDSVARSLWYIYVLLQFYILSPLFYYLSRHNPVILLLLSIVLHFIPASSIVGLNFICEYTIFVSIGFLVRPYYSETLSFIVKNIRILIIAFAASWTLVLFTDEKISKLVIGSFSLPVFFYLGTINYLRNNIVIKAVSDHTFSIYLLNTIVIGICKSIHMHFLPWGGLYFAASAPVIWLLATILPMMIGRYSCEISRFYKRSSSER